VVEEQAMSGGEVPDDLLPFYDTCLIYGFGMCDGCGREQPFDSRHLKFSDGWWLDEARAMKAAGWVVPEPLQALCPECARRHAASD